MRTSTSPAGTLPCHVLGARAPGAEGRMRSTAMNTKLRLERSVGIGITLLAALVGQAHAVPGFLDQAFGSFGSGGRIVSDLGMGKVVLQTDGKIITAERDDQGRVAVIR